MIALLAIYLDFFDGILQIADPAARDLQKLQHSYCLITIKIPA